VTAAEELLAEWGEAHPDALRLAETVALATHVEPALLRAARLALRPRAPSSSEAEVWFSPLVDAASPSGLTFARAMTEALRERLAADPGRLQRARDVVAGAHRSAPETQQLEEEIAWRALRAAPEDPRCIDELWRRAAATILREQHRAPKLSRWARRALDSAPDTAREGLGARDLRSCLAVHAGPLPPAPTDASQHWEPWVVPTDIGTVPVGIRLLADGVQATLPPSPGAHVIDVPATQPPMLQIGVASTPPGDPHAIPSGEGLSLAVCELAIWLVDEARPFASFTLTGRPLGLAMPSWPGFVAALLEGDAVEVISLSDGRDRTRMSAPADTVALRYAPDDELLLALDGRGVVWITPTSGEAWAEHDLQAPEGVTVVGLGATHLAGIQAADGRLVIVPLEASALDAYTVPLDPGRAPRRVTLSRDGGAVLIDDGEELLAYDRSGARLRPVGVRRSEGDGQTLAIGGAIVAAGAGEDGVQLLRGAISDLVPEAQVLPTGRASALAVSGNGAIVAVASPPQALELRTLRGERFLLERERVAPETPAVPESRIPAREVWRGAPFPLGARWDGEGTNFSLFSEHAQRVELCLFGEGGVEERIDVTHNTVHNWHCYLPGTGPGQRYGYRVHGPYAPLEGHRFNAHKLLVDPYARAIDGPVDWEAANVLPYRPTDTVIDDADLEFDDEDSAPAIPKAVVVDDSFDWEGDRSPQIPWAETVIYETHVKGFTHRHPDVAPEVRGTYAGLASPAAIGHLKDLGVTAVELLPVHQIADESFLLHSGLKNYWGYSTLGFFAPHSEYAAAPRADERLREFKQMIKALHGAGIEVLLDVVYNHTAEGNHLGPMLSFKGVDNTSYYRLVPDDPHFYMDFTGTGNTLNTINPAVLRMIVDSLRYFVIECHVDGFRFDLASALARSLYEVDRLSSFFDTIHQDPVLSQVKLIAEPWDVGPGGYQVGNFPVLWSEWNGIYRDMMRDFWRGEATLSQFAARFTGSGDLYGDDGRNAFASINFITAHDGFTLRDLVSYNDKHNAANQEGNRDGTDDNRSWNCGVEGDTDDPQVLALRARQQRNILTTLLLSQGVPMLLGGDEQGRTQHGNNNGWCQDNELSWYDWALSPEQETLRAFTRRLVTLRRSEPVFRREGFLVGDDSVEAQLPDVWWFRPDGYRMTRRDWEHEQRRGLGVFLNGEATGTLDHRGQPVRGDSFLVLFNGAADEDVFEIPAARFGRRWSLELSTATPELAPGDRELGPGNAYPMVGRSITVLRRAD
jgi:isoamylase